MADKSPVILDFTKLWSPTTDLNFGGSISADDVSATITATYDLNAQASITVTYDSNVFRGVVCERQAKFESSRLMDKSEQGKFEPSSLITDSKKAIFEQSKLVGQQADGTYENNRLIATNSLILTEQSRLIGRSRYLVSNSNKYIGKSANVLTEASRLIGKHSSILTESMVFVGLKQQYKTNTGKLISKQFAAEYKSALFTAYALNIMAETAKIPPWLLIPDEPVTPETNPVILNFECPWFAPSSLLNFGVGCQHQVDPDDKPIFSDGVIFVINDLLLTRIDSGDEIKMLSFNVGIDNSSYCWTFSANVPFTELSKVDITNEPEIEVELMVNGQAWRFILDACDDNSQFNSSSLSIKGKSRASRLAYPFAQHRGYKYTAPMTARQIANDELNRNSIPSGFTLDWQLVSELGWDVPANTYSYSNRTPINSLQWIAEAAGGFINSHPSDDVIRVLSNYPIPSWEWAEQTPSIIIPEQLITSRSRNRVQKSRYNGVMVSGEREGSISALVKRSGTSGGYTPNQVVSDLITDTAVARHRGQCVLSDTGDIGNIGLSLPMHSAIGLLTPSTLIRVNDGGSWVGMVRGTTISGSLGGNGSLQIEQSIDVERHFDKEVV